VPLGLSYVAVAREFGDKKFMLNAVEKNGYPWQSYVDIDDIDCIWAKMDAQTQEEEYS